MKIIIISVIIVIALLLSSANNSNSSQSDNYQTTTDIDKGTYEAEVSSEDNEITNSLDFNGYECTTDCSGHEAGYEWAEEHGITQDDVDNYSGNSNSFMEGMQSYIDESY